MSRSVVAGARPGVVLPEPSESVIGAGDRAADAVLRLRQPPSGIEGVGDGEAVGVGRRRRAVQRVAGVGRMTGPCTRGNVAMGIMSP